MLVALGKLDDYSISTKLGEGTFSEVSKVKHRKTNAVFAMKRFRKSFSSLEEISGLREIQALKRLNPHPNIIELIEIIFDERSGTLCLNFELMDCNLYEVLARKNSTLTEEKCRTYVKQIFTGLDYIHGKGIFHRDIKPENILVKDSMLKIADLGSCRGIYSKQPYTEYIATRWYRSPECLLCEGMYSYKMDIWGVGCVLFEMLTKNPLFPGSNKLDQIHRIHAVMGTPPAKTLKLMLGNKYGSSKYNFPEREGTGIRRYLGHVSNECVDFIYLTIRYNPEDRCNSKDALRHPWLLSAGDLPTDARTAPSTATANVTVATTTNTSSSAPSPQSGKKGAGLPDLEQKAKLKQKQQPESTKIYGGVVVVSKKGSVKEAAPTTNALPPLVKDQQPTGLLSYPSMSGGANKVANGSKNEASGNPTSNGSTHFPEIMNANKGQQALGAKIYVPPKQTAEERRALQEAIQRSVARDGKPVNFDDNRLRAQGEVRKSLEMMALYGKGEHRRHSLTRLNVQLKGQSSVNGSKKILNSNSNLAQPHLPPINHNDPNIK